MDDFDARFDDRRRRRTRRFENEADDAWGAAEEDDLAEPDLVSKTSRRATSGMT